MKNELRKETWIMHTFDGFWYPITPSVKCKPEDHGNLNNHIIKIEDVEGNILWERKVH